MRLIGNLDNETAARTFGDYLFVQGIENQVEFQTGDGWGIWVSDEDKLEGAIRLLGEFRASPGDPKYQKQAKSAVELRAEQEKKEAAYRKKVRDRRQLFRPLAGYGFGPVTLLLIAASVVVFLWSGFGDRKERIMSLFITGFSDVWDPTLPEIRHGQIWRLFTPIFIHFGVVHILFNMLCLRDLGSMIEGRQSSWQLLLLVLVIAPCSNLAEVLIGRVPDFGGMSGVVYGLMGYVWIRGKFDPGSGLFVHPTTVTMMIIWFFACFTGLLGPIANTVHTVGLGMGMAWGYLSSLRYR